MGEGDVGAALHDMVLVVLKLGAPCLVVALAVGVTMSLVQAVTQVNEATLALTGSFMLATLTDYTQGLFDQMVAIGGQ